MARIVNSLLVVHLWEELLMGPGFSRDVTLVLLKEQEE